MKWLRTLAPWVWALATAASTVALLVLNVTSKGSNSPATTGAVLIIAFLGLVSNLAPQLQAWRTRRFQVAVLPEQPQEPITVGLDGPTVLDEWRTRRRDQLLVSLHRAQERQAGTASSTSSIRALNDIAEMAEKAAWAVGRRPDQRTPQLYQDQVDRYLVEAEEALRDALRRRYTEARVGALTLRLVNKTNRTFKNVRVVLRLPGWADVIDQEQLPDRPTTPEPPTPFGTPTMVMDIASSSLTNWGLTRMHKPVPPGRPEVREVDDQVVITYPEVTLRPHEQDRMLPVLHLWIRDGAPASMLPVRWEATAEDADGLITEKFDLPLSDDDPKILAEQLIPRMFATD
jgi:hypothetical protein